MKIRVVCTQAMSFIVGHGCQVWSLDAGENQPSKEVRHQASFEMADQEAGHGSISIRVANEYELAKWVPGMEYELMIEGSSLVAAEDTFDEMVLQTAVIDSLVAHKMVSNPFQPIGPAEGGGQTVDDKLSPVNLDGLFSLDDHWNSVKEKGGESITALYVDEPHEVAPVDDLNVDADE